MGRRKDLIIKSKSDTGDSAKLAWGPFGVTVRLHRKYYVMELIAATHASGLRYTGDTNGEYKLTSAVVSDWFYNEFLPEKKYMLFQFIFKGGGLKIVYPERDR